MRPAFLVWLFVLALAMPALARVGETLDQCKKRYGKATEVAQPYDFGDQARELAYFNFEKNGIAIQVGFLNGIASDLSFHHLPDPSAPPGPVTPFTQVEIDTLLSDNASGKTWKTISADGKLIFFPDTPALYIRYGSYQLREDGVMSTVDGTTLHIFTPDWMEYVNEKMKAHSEEETVRLKKNLEGF